MFQRFSRILTAIALIQILGGHWAILQTVGWVGMVISYAQHDLSLPQALKKTFDGKDPCEVCKIVKSGRENEEKHELSSKIVKFEAVLVDGVQLPPAPEAFRYLLKNALDLPDGVSVVPTQPPRRA